MPTPTGVNGAICGACMCCIPAGNIIGGIYKPAPIDIICIRRQEAISHHKYIIYDQKILSKARGLETLLELGAEVF